MSRQTSFASARRRSIAASLTPRQRRVLYAIAYEAIAVAVVGPGLAFVFDRPVSTSVGLAVVMSGVALVWSYAFNAWFERWESRRRTTHRSIARRMLHGVGFEGGLVLMLVPLIAWWCDTTLLHAFLADLGVFAFFLVYAVAFTWAFDRLFGLPHSVHRTGSELL